jgi:uncharacterized lipoprotein YmbA
LKTKLDKEMKMKKRISSAQMLLIHGLLVIGLLGCASSPPTRFYVLSPEKGEGVGDQPCVSIGIGPVKIPEYLNRSGIMTRIAAHELQVGEFDQWAEPLEENIPRVLAENLRSLLCTKAVAVFPWKGRIPMDYRVYVDVIRMDGRLGGDALLDASWTLMGGPDKREMFATKRVSYKESTGGQDYEGYVSAQSRNLWSLSHDIAEAIKNLSNPR